VEGYFSHPRTILIVSPQAWNAPNVSKHHYARLLGAMGHRVYFVEPPDHSRRDRNVTILPSDAEGVSLVRYRLPFPYRIKFHARALFIWLMKGVARRVARAIPEPIDLVWDFDNEYMFHDLGDFSPDFSIFHPVDDIAPQFSSTKHAQLILANNGFYISSLPESGARTALIPHGTQASFLELARARLDGRAPAFREVPRVVGYVGNLDRKDIDWDALYAVIGAHPELEFQIIGPYRVASPPDPRIERLSSFANVTLLGRLESQEVIARSAEIDIWFVAYRYEKAKGLIYPHKINEFLATGKPVLASPLSFTFPDGAVTCSAFEDNRDMPALLAGIVADYAAVGAPLAAMRARFAAENSYADHIATISRLIADVKAG
jgi:glycosyltransferase involved in cell wall biosynthesis